MKKIYIDSRALRGIRIKTEKGTSLASLVDTFKINNTKVSYTRPNIVAIFLSMSDKAYLKSFEIYNTLIKKKIALKKSNYTIEELPLLYNYFEILSSSILFAYNAVEAFANLSIPDDFIYETIDSKTGVKQLWKKESIERWKLTGDKVSEIVPVALGLDKPTQQQFWDDFKKLENIRNEIVHPRTDLTNPTLPFTFMEYFFKACIFRWIKSAKLVIKYFCKEDETRLFHPYGYGKDDLINLTLKESDYREYEE